MLLKAAPSLAEPPVFHNEKDEGKASSFSCCPSSSSAVRKTERKRNRGSFVLVEKEFGMRVTVLIVLIALVRADALGEDLMDDHGGDAAGNNGGIKEYLEETRQAFKNFRGSHGHEAHPDGHGNDDGFTSVHFMLQQDADTRTGDGPKKDDQRAPEHGAGQKLENTTIMGNRANRINSTPQNLPTLRLATPLSWMTPLFWENVATGKQPNIAPREVIMPSQRMPPAKRLR